MKPKPSAALWSASTQAAIGEWKRRSTRTSPPPMRVIGAMCRRRSAGRFMMFVSAVFMSTALISMRPAARVRPVRSAAEPVTIGAAPDVPPKGAVPVPLPATAETEAPGAPISGLMRLVRLPGPREDEPTMCPTSGIPLAGSKVTRADAAFMAVDVAWLTM